MCVVVVGVSLAIGPSNMYQSGREGNLKAYQAATTQHDLLSGELW
jgi:hypothetical protein